jgi:hypothetical protein
MAEFLIVIYAAVGVIIGLWIGFHGPLRPDNVIRVSAVLCIVLLWPFFVLHTLRS